MCEIKQTLTVVYYLFKQVVYLCFNKQQKSSISLAYRR